MYRHTFTFVSQQKAELFAKANESVLEIWEKREGQSPREISLLTYTPKNQFEKNRYKRMMEPLEVIQSGLTWVHINEPVDDWNPSIAQYFDPGMAAYARTPEYTPDF